MKDRGEFPLLVLTRGFGARCLLRLRRMGRMGVFLCKGLLYVLIPPLKFSRVLKQIRFVGMQSTLVIFLTGAFTGMVLGLQGYYTLTRVGSEAFLGPMVGLALIRELGPSSLRDTLGSVGDGFLDPVNYLATTPLENASVRAYERVNATSLTLGEYEDLKRAALDPYIALRSAFYQHRQNKIRE